MYLSDRNGWRSSARGGESIVAAASSSINGGIAYKQQ